MAYDLGVQLGIDGEKEFRDSIRAIDGQLKTFAAQMQAVTAEFEDNAQSEEALTQKNKVLRESISTVEKQLDVLSKQTARQKQRALELADALEKAKKEFGENSEEAGNAQNAYNKQIAEVNKLETRIAKATANLNKMNNQLRKNTDSLDGLGNELTDTSKDFSVFGNVLSANLAASAISGTISTITGKIQELGAAMMDYSRESENAAAKATAYFGETGQAAEQTEKIIKDVYLGGVGDSMDAVADAVIAVKNNLDDLSETDIKNLTNQAITLENAYGIDMNETLRGVNSLMEQFGLTAQEAMDYIVAGTQNGLDKTNELGDNLSEYAGKFSQAGYSAEEYFQLLNNGLDGGAYNLDKVNDAINEVTTRLADGTIGDAIKMYSSDTQSLFSAWESGEATQKQVIDSIVSDIKAAENQQEALNMAAEAFGTMAEDGSLKFIESLTSVGDTYTEVTGKAQEMFDATTTSQQTLDSAMRTAQAQLAPIGDKLNEIAVTIIPLAAQAFASFAGTMMEYGPQITALIAGIAAGFVAWNISSIVSSVSTALGTMKTAILGVNAAISANPIGALITLIVALVTTIVTFIATNEEAQQKLLAAWELIKTTVAGVIQTVGEAITGFGQTISGVFQSAVETVSGFVSSITQKAQEVGTSIINGLQSGVEYVSGLPSKFLTWGKDMISNMVDGIKSGINAVGDAVEAVADKISAFLHFSEPDIGPLSNFHTYMPDMTKLLASGIREGIPTVTRAVEELSTAMVPNTVPIEANGTAAAYNRLADSLGNMQIVLNDGTLVGKLTPRIDAALGGYTKIKGRYYT